jgi:hypothetical protein
MLDAARRGVAATGSYSSMMADCVIADSRSSLSIACGVNFARCRFLRNVSLNGMVCRRSSPQWNSSCFFLANTNLSSSSSSVNGLVMGASTDYSRLFNCTLVGEPSEGRLASCYSSSVNCIYDGGYFWYGTSANTNCVVWNYKSDYSQGVSEARLEADPCFVNREADGALYAVSPAVGYAGAPTATNYGADFWKFAMDDIGGNFLAVASDGRLTVGAFQEPVPAAYAVLGALVHGGLAVEGLTVGSNLVTTASSFRVTPADGTRPCAGVTVNGVTNLFTNGAASELVFSGAALIAAADADGAVAIEPLYTTDWYVDDDGDDSASGFFPTAAKKTLAAAMPLLASGDTLHALPGAYAEGEMTNKVGCLCGSRVVIPAGRALVSTEGPERTFIVGAGEDGLNATTQGAVRCAYMDGTWARLEGFTLTGGRVLASGTEGADEEDMTGGAVSGASPNYRVPEYGVVVKNCIISNNVSPVGVVRRCQLVDCRVVGNVCGDGGNNVLVYQGSAYGCYFDDNVCGGIFRYSANVMNTTVTAGNCTSSGDPIARCFHTPGHTPADRSRLFNSVLGAGISIENSTADISNCVMTVANTVLTGKDECRVGGNVLTNLDVIVFDASGAPVRGVNPAVDLADPALVADYPCDLVRDLAGRQRVWNARMDAGAIEADWRPRYAADIWRLDRLSVTMADPAIYENADGRVAIPSGSLTAEVYGKADVSWTCEITVAMTGGTLAVTRDGEVLGVFTGGVQTLKLKSARAVEELVFSFTPAAENPGEAVICSIRSDNGTVLLLR